MSSWTFESIPDQTHRTAIVTGANTGIGFETARQLALKGAQVVLACRNPDKAQAAVDRILAEKADAAVSIGQLDLSDLDNIAAFASRIRDHHAGIDLLILNAGVMVPPASKTAQGFELQFGVNHLGHFALTGHLLPLLRAQPGARVVAVSSLAALRGQMDFEDLQFEKRGYQPWPAYGQSKLANLLFIRELQRRLDAAGADIKVTAAHPGWTATDLQRTSTVYRILNPFLAMKPPQGALPTLRAATDPAANGADYFGPGGFMQARGYPVRIDMNDRAQSPKDASRLWQVSERLTGVGYGL
jgi:NAD(P)-dependent dehydrogenase (short-subunit alcohol dehydrogenase family)